MTQEEPRQRKESKGIVCDECNQTVYPDHNDNGVLTLQCGCENKQRSIRVAAVFPEGWQP